MHMTQWYYVDSNRQQLGPVAQDQLVQQYRLGNLTRDTLIWRDGMGQWQPLRDCANELGLPLPAAAIAEPAPVQTRTESVEERPLTGRAVFTAREPTYAQHAATHASHAEAATGAQAGMTATAAESPYSPPFAPLSHDIQAVVSGHVVQAGFWKRYAASSIDGLLLMLAFVAVWIIASLAFGFGISTLATDMASGALSPLLILVLYLVPIVVQAVYFTWMHASDYQATIGKMAIGIKVVRSDGVSIMTGRSLSRWAAYFFMHLFSCGLSSVVSAFTVGLGQRKQGLHDMIGDTQVVDRWAYTRFPDRQREELGAVTITVIALTALLGVAYVLVLLVAIPLMSR
jgi:uncharacterized RDD family membrane protein YckC